MRRVTSARNAAAVAIAVVGLLLPGTAYGARGAAPRAATPRGTLAGAAVIGVDNASPSGHNFQYTGFYPGSAAFLPIISSGTVVDFKWNQGSLDGFHTATLLSQTQTPPGVWGSTQLATPDSDNGEQLPNQNPAAFAPTDPTCGTATSPCVYAADTAPGLLSSGAAPTAPGNDFFVKITSASTITVSFICLIHPGMAGRLQVGGTPTTAAANSGAASSEYTADTNAALAAEKAVTPGKAANADGSTTWTLTAGTATPQVEVLEMLPLAQPIGKNDKVKWTTGTMKDIHTVTFPYGAGSDPVDPFAVPPQCEVASGPDTMAPNPGGAPPFGCTTAPELPLDPTAHGPTTITRHAYRMAASDGGVFVEGDAPFLGSEAAKPINKPVVGQASTSDGMGYWNVASDGGIFAHGNAGFFGSMGNRTLNKPVVGLMALPSSDGYAEVASDGGIFNFGNFPYAGSMGGAKLNSPVVGGAVNAGFFTPGYYEVAADGGVFAFGNAPFLGSMGGRKLNKPIVGMAVTPDGFGYWLVASDGGIFAFGDARYMGSMGGFTLNKPIVGMAASPSGFGYWLVASDGGIFAFGDAKFFGSTGNLHLNMPVVGMSAMPATVATAGILANPPAPFPSTTAVYSFPDSGGVFTYQCRIHDNMFGVIVVG